MAPGNRRNAARKLRKLVTDPRLFFEDAVRNRWAAAPSFGAAKQLAERTLGRPFALFEPPAADRASSVPFSMQTLLDALARRYAVLMTVDAVECSIGVLHLELVGVLHLLADTARQHGLLLQIEVGGHVHPVQFGISGEAMQALRVAERLTVSFHNAAHALLAFDMYPYRERNGVLATRAPEVAMSSLPALASGRLLAGGAGLLWPEEALGGERAADGRREVDCVYTWVNAAEPAWQQLYQRHFRRPPDLDRFVARDELRYSLRSLSYYCGWARKIFIVSNCAPPAWLDLDHPKIVWVDHSEVMSEQYLPTFNSHAIEAALPRVPGLARHFVYMNDDVFVTRALRPEMFFDRLGRSRVFLEPAGVLVPDRSPREEPWFLARLGAQRVLLERYGHVATRLHHHAPFAVNRDHCLDMFGEFPGEVARTERSRVRAETDCPLLAFLYPHYVLARGIGSEYPAQAQVFKLANYRRFSLAPETAFLCLNDGVGSAEDREFGAAASSLMHARFPFPAPWERHV